MKTRIIWLQGFGGGRYIRKQAPHRRQGGTCEHNEQVLIYDELPGEVKVEGGFVFWQGQEYCPADKVAAILDKEGQQVYP